MAKILTFKVKNISGKTINVLGIPREPDTEFEAEETQEIKNLILTKYLGKVEEN
ncbi:hypothetical protein MUP79_03370 [Candidatus Bathyarchaeota archaeon]|nr:hypothetical protein [Candidatus Bathyarchaeota archaeon]